MVSAFIDGDRALGQRLAGLGHASIPVIVLGEFRYGLAGSRHRAAYEAWLDDHLSDFDVLAASSATAVVYADVRLALKKKGRPIPSNDVWISALALEHRLPVLTRDVHFDAVPGLRRVEW
ncbi:MAG: PIN domain-containing protein [Vicinamibacteria bacterium]|nr:PIN domain-containing protein [Vicinamibacteria bacterium]